ncbi:MAG: hypothetical protein COA87_015305 [Halomonas sp.]|jgi:hypothetical protein|nr:hypothetical protein [Halomonas sp.]MBL1269077.1 hypothetical protein [Halomonas sp.]
MAFRKHCFSKPSFLETIAFRKQAISVPTYKSREINSLIKKLPFWTTILLLACYLYISPISNKNQLNQARSKKIFAPTLNNKNLNTDIKNTLTS